MASKQQDPQVDLIPTGELFEVLTEAPNGHRTVHRFRAKDRAAAEKRVRDELDPGKTVVGAAVAGAGLGSGDAA